jgi:hypothetical protein
VHDELQHAGDVPVVQVVPQLPQLLASLSVSVQAPPQQAGVVPELQNVPQLPQLNRSESVSVQDPPQQGVVPVLQ